MAGYYETYESRSRRRQTGRSVLGYWLPLAVTVTAATVGLATWIWSERHEDDNDDTEDDYDGERKKRREKEHDQYDAEMRRREVVEHPRAPSGHEAEAFEGPSSSSTRGEQRELQDVSTGMVARMSGAIRRSPSPQQILDEASRRVAAGVAAAGAVVGGALSSIREESRDDYGDHSRWSEEADMRAAHSEMSGHQAARAVANVAKQPPSNMREAEAIVKAETSRSTTPAKSNLKRKTVAVVVSADTNGDFHGAEPNDHHEDASILSHLPAHIDYERSRLFVLIYGPDLKQHPLSTTGSTKPAGSVTSSFSNIAHDEARTPGEEPDKALESIDPEPIHSLSPDSNAPVAPKLTGSESSSFQALYTQAQALVEKDTMVLPFTTPSGHIHLLRHLAPDVVYIQDSLSGEHGDLVTQISGWVGQVVVVVGAEGGHGGLIDSEDETAQGAESREKWWQQGDRVGLGKGIEVVDGMRIGEDWRKRVGGHE